MRIQHAFGLFAAALVSASSFADLRTDFSITNGNPNGAWTYGTLSALGGSFTAFGVSQTGTAGSATFDSWSATLGTLPAASQLTSGSLVGYNGGNGIIALGDVVLHGGPSGELAAVRWTAPTSGVFNLSGYFNAGDGLGSSFGRIDGYVYQGSNQLYSVLNTDVDNTFSLSNVALSAGQSIDVIVGIGQDSYLYDSTPVNLRIDAVPEPGTLAALGAGLLLCIRRRAR